MLGDGTGGGGKTAGNSDTFLGYFDLVAAAYVAGFRGDALITACAIAVAESGSNPWARNYKPNLGADARGLWQINMYGALGPARRKQFGLRSNDDLYQPSINARVAYSISKGGRDWKPWSVYTSGAYKKWLGEFREDVGRLYPGEPGGHNPDNPSADVPSSSGPIFSPALPQDGGMPLRIAGKLVAGELGNYFTGGRVEYSAAESSMLTTSFVDDGYALTDKAIMGVGSVINFDKVRWQIDSISVDHSGHTPITTARSLPVGVKVMRRQSPNGRSGISPTEYMKAIAKACELGFVGEPTKKQDVVPAAVNRTVDPLLALDPSMKVEKLPPNETAWELGSRLASELGFVMFESKGTLYFASHGYLFLNQPAMYVSNDGANLPGGAKWWSAITPPRVKVGATRWKLKKTGTGTRRVAIAEDIQYDLDLPREAFGSLKIGQGVGIAGVGAFGLTAAGNRTDVTMLTNITLDLTDPTAPVSVSAQSASLTAGKGVVGSTVATPAPGTGTPATPGDGNDTGNTGKGVKGSKRALDFVDFCLAQKGDAYVYGAEVRLTDNDPDVWDCSELVQWAAYQVGITYPDGSGNQYAYSAGKGLSISIDKAAHTRGALLFRGTGPLGSEHVVVSLGTGNHTIEARGHAYGVVSANILGRHWDCAALIPGMRY